MKNTSVFRVLIFSWLLLALVSCKEKKQAKTEKEQEKTVEVDKGFQEYVSAFTDGVISSESIIRIKLTSEYKQNVEAGTPLDAKVFSFEPKVKGQAVWADAQTIEFKPDAPFSSGMAYKCAFLLKKILPESEQLGDFPLSFQVINQSFQVELGELQPDESSYRFTGRILTADVMDGDKVEALLNATFNDNQLAIVWSHNRAANVHEFEIQDIKREEDDAAFVINWDGNPYGMDVADSKRIEIPGLNNFKLISAQVYHTPSQYVLLTFSDPLKKTQNLKGLIQIRKQSRLKYLIEDNQVKVYINGHITGDFELSVHRGIKNTSNYSLKKATGQTLTFEAVKPDVRLIGNGIIIPNSNGLIFPFEAVNLNAVDVRIIKIYEDNVAQFLQINALDGNSELKRVGRLVVQKKIDLIADNMIDYSSWNAFSFDLSELVATEPGAIYKVEINFRKSYSLYPCSEESGEDYEPAEEKDWDEVTDDESSYWDSSEDYYNDNEYYSWSDRENPCTRAYYRNRRVSRNVLASNMALIAKTGSNNEMKVFATDLLTALPLVGVDVELLDFQQEVLGTAQTDDQGIATLSYDKKPFLLVAKSGEQRGYLKLDNGNALSLSMFDVGGVKYNNGIKGFIYGERGVWRPGDTLFLTFILDDKDAKLPSTHPVNFELIDPYGKTVKQMVKSSSVGKFYHFKCATSPDAPTGNWMARVRIGGSIFTKEVKVETVKPNRLKINLDFDTEIIRSDDENLFGKMEVKWLHGAIAKELMAVVYMELAPMRTRFKSFTDYIFDDPSVNFENVETTIFSDRLDELGKAEISPALEVMGQSPGMLKATFSSRVYEEGGNFSVNQIAIPYAPYKHFVGVKVPKGDKRRGMLLTDVKHKINVVTLDADGKKVSVNNMVGKLYKLSWRWWWQSGSDNIGDYIQRQHTSAILEKIFSTKDGVGSFEVEVKYPDWGRYIIKVESPDGHSTGKIVYIDWPGWAGRAQGENSGGASMLSFSSDKKKYTVGEEASISMPSSAGGRALVSIEKGSRVVDAFWVNTEKDETNFTFKVTEEMSPNVFVSVTALQPHGQMKNDLPIRMYGVIPVQVENPASRLAPVITMADELKPESEVHIAVSEKNGEAMTFTLAVVDEGLLDLTNYRTPNPWSSFYAREALSVRTWDLYDLVFGSYGAKIEAAFAIGGDGEGGAKNRRKAQRFKPVVKYFGPYTLEKGEKRDVSFIMPRYIGAVKAMVIAGNDKAYGAATKSVPVKSPLMLFATMPRVLSPQENVKLPVTLFALGDKIGTIKVKLKTNDLIEIIGESEYTLSPKEAGEFDFNFEVKSTDKMGIAHLEVVATSGDKKATYKIEMNVRAPNPPRIENYSAVVKPNANWKEDFDVFGINGTNSAVLEVSGMPAINFSKRMRYLIHYPYGCIEQTTSSVFPQLYMGKVLELDNDLQAEIKNNVNKGLERLSSFQLANGGFSYWPGGKEVNEWGTNYAGHFIVEAEEQGYPLPIGMKDAWLAFQTETASNWKLKSDPYNANGFTQAYRLFTLALADHANLGAMNRLKETPSLSKQAHYYLSMAYVYSGNKEAAKQMLQSIRSTQNMNVSKNTFGSKERDIAIVLESYLALEMYDEAMPLIKSMSDALNNSRWMSTQTTAFCLRAMCKASQVFVGANDKFSYTFSLNGEKTTKITSTALINQYQVPLKGGEASRSISLKNKSKAPIYINFSVEGTPLVDTLAKEEKNIELDVVYKTLDDYEIEPGSIEQGTSFKAEVTVKNISLTQAYTNLALAMMFPSGWEINNTRLYGGGAAHMKSTPDYQDIRDDRVNTFFDLKHNQTKTFVVLLNASYLGEYTMPAIQCSAMYDNEVRARIPGQKISVVPPGK